MDKKIFAFFSSTRLMAVLFIVFAAALGIGTFIEDRYNTDTARIMIYNAKWFEAIMLIFVFNFIGNIKRYQLHKKEKWATLLLHLSFILILTGAFVTRYISFEGMMPIREGEASSHFFSDKTFLTVMADGDYQGEMKRLTFEEPKLMSGATNNYFKMKKEFNGIPFEVEYKDYIMGATEEIQADEKGVFFLKMVESGDGERHEHFLKEGEVTSIHNVLFAFNQPTAGAINIHKDGDNYAIDTPFEGDFMRMADQFKGTVAKDSKQELMFRSLYNVAGAKFVFPELPTKGKIVLKSNGNYKDTQTENALVLTVRTQGKEEEIILKGNKGRMGVPTSIQLGDLEFTMMFGSKTYELPFKIQLNEFVADKYPGTEKSYSAFESKVTVIAPDEKFDARIFMNNILDYKGYRFFQAQFDEDEKGTILSVNHDWWGTWITYIGYTFLYIGMLAILFDRDTRFNDLRKKLNKVREKKAKLLTLLILFCSVGMFAQSPKNHSHNIPNLPQLDSLLVASQVSEEHAAHFGSLVIQDAGGRMKPINTFSSELLRKVSKSDHYKKMNSDQVFLSMTQFPQLWYNVPLIELKRGNDSLRATIGVDKKAKYAALVQFFDDKGNYKLGKSLDDANHAGVKNQFQKDFIEVDTRVNLLYAALSGKILTIFPIPNDANNKWVSYLELNEAGMKGMDSLYTKEILPLYMTSLLKSIETKDYKAADEFLVSLHGFQKKYGANVIPSDSKVKAELLYNKYDVFKSLYTYYMLVAVVMFIFIIIQIVKPAKFAAKAIRIFTVVTWILFVAHTLGLAMRWYVSGHAPWSDAYESMIYVGWATMLFGIYFGRKSELTIAATAFVAGMILWTAHLNWMDPSIANLQPVLNSYWLMIHVAVIVASYGPFTLGMILGIVALILMLFTNDKNKAKMQLNIKEITYINEMALTVGLVLLTIGNFLGGQWANESWGRYWGWDPKETWALVSIMMYAFVIHMRFVPALRGTWIYNLISILAFYVIIMTYFGVNFYLTGLHSYAKGEKIVTPDFIYISIALVGLLGLFSYFKYKKYLKK
ncbi:cytochrome c biogenesis protein CcsA [Flavobacterium sp. HSC-61S13]|uniref:cytochrome c biogenesis protein CcsA n=1 Tax=Flavobacterium sp. HSC-61S13 TaxID=2910963 RepID=UPI00209F7A34|nr:cytochrome c biogenesis protein CcsA [Flavobacterium sp. HSC-61S13]MCP1994269.1 cytochrome c-type biogenesis protein CcsB [Flavobacterium sp. HSC-61S13]